jgi:RNA polymerase sigma factor (TIGR02999 family)
MAGRPTMASDDEITALLAQAGKGDRQAEERLLTLIYGHLREIARTLSSNQGHEHTLSTTALVHEAFINLFDKTDVTWTCRHQFFAYAARAMRNLLVDQARRRTALKRGGDLARDDDALAVLPVEVDASEVVAVDQALTALADIDARLADVVQLHVFAGLSLADVAHCLNISERTVHRDWEKARLALKSLMA